MRSGSVAIVMLLLGSVVALPSQATVVALKRDPGLQAGGAIDIRFQSAATSLVQMSDAPLGSAGSGRWYNYGAKTNSNASSSANYVLYKFDLTAVADLPGSRVRLAELRLYHTSGNNGNELGQIVTHDWVEGASNGTYPGASPGVSLAHPVSTCTGPSQNADGGTMPPLQSWAATANNFFDPAVDVAGKRAAKSIGGAAAFSVFTVTDIVAVWASGAAPNYGFYQLGGNYVWQMSEVGWQYQPVLFIDYIPNGAPPAVADLAAGNPDWNKVDLAWTAPADALAAPLASYDIRCSTSPITDDATWAAATRATGEPIPASPGQRQTFTVSGLSAFTPYHFALKSTDVAGLVSPLSNVPTMTTLVRDIAPPAAVADLAAANVMPMQLELRWTASGDDGMAGTAAIYDIRYSTSPISEANFASAAIVVQNLTPKSAGAAERLVVTNLIPQMTYHFAMKVTDSHQNASALSNVLLVATPPVDTVPPAAIADLVAVTVDTTKIRLTWTAPGNDGQIGTAASCELRSSTSPISEANWTAAAQVPGVPIPGPAGTTEQFSVGGLQPMVTYYFAIKTTDGSGNVSALSNVAMQATARGTAITNVTIVEKASVTTANYPLTLSLAFRRGDVISNVTAIIADQAVPTQTDVKVHYEDGSVRHALVSLLIPTLPANGQVVLTFFAGGVNANNVPITKDVLLGGDFDAVMSFTVGGQTTNVSARQMLQAAGTPETWIQGNICTEFLLKDFGSNIASQLNVQYRVRIYQGWSGYRVDTVVENCWTQYRGNLTYDFSLALGQANPATVLSRTGFAHNYCARWHKVCWEGGEPGDTQVRLDVPYMISTGLIPQYDLSLAVPESTLATEYSKWQKTNHDIMGSGIITTSFGTTGGRQEIGLLPTWAVRYLLSWDSRQREILFNCADVSGHIPIHYRESDPARSFYGRIMSINDRPTIWNNWWDFSGTTAADKMPAPIGSTSTAWSVDMSHQASFAYVPYLVSGDYYYLEEMLFWAGYNLSWGNPGYRQYSAGLLSEQTRGEGWGIRNIAHAAILTPDAFSEKAYLRQKIANNLTQWTNEYVPGSNYPCIRYWQVGSTLVRPDDALDPNCLYYTLPWQDDFVLLVMSHLKDLGYDTRALINWLGVSVVGRFTSPGFNPFRGVDYRIPTQYNDGSGSGVPYATWHDIDQAYVDQPGPTNFADYEYSDSYAYIARAALACTVHMANGKATWDWLDSHLHSQSELNQDPTWAILPVSVFVGDIDRDGGVDVVDLLTLADAWGSSFGQTAFNPDCDLNGDNTIDVGDLLCLAQNWGR